MLYFVVCYTMKPLVYADQFSHTGQKPPVAAQHCSLPFHASDSAAPHSGNHTGTASPDCCASMKAEGARAFSGQIALPSLSLLTWLPSDLNGRTQGVQQHPVSLASHSANPPPLYLAYAVLLL